MGEAVREVQLPIFPSLHESGRSTAVRRCAGNRPPQREHGRAALGPGGGSCRAPSWPSIKAAVGRGGAVLPPARGLAGQLAGARDSGETAPAAAGRAAGRGGDGAGARAAAAGGPGERGGGAELPAGAGPEAAGAAGGAEAGRRAAPEGALRAPGRARGAVRVGGGLGGLRGAEEGRREEALKVQGDPAQSGN